MTNMEKRQITRLREQGLGYTQIANRLGISKSTVSTFCQRNGLAEEKKEKPQKPNNRSHQPMTVSPFNFRVNRASDCFFTHGRQGNLFVPIGFIFRMRF